MKVKIDLIIDSFDSKGNFIKRIKRRANSLLQNFQAILAIQMAGTSLSPGPKDTGGTTRNVVNNAGNFSVIAASGTVTRGIVVGTGTTAVALTDYVLQTPIAHGTSSGQLSYGTQNVPTFPTISGSSCYFETNRSISNGSGSNITVNEVGLYVQFSSSYNVMIDHTLNTFTINNGTSATYTYRITITL